METILQNKPKIFVIFQLIEPKVWDEDRDVKELE
jgi:hypothetical protein